jgi:hypothetical protein
LGIKKKIDELSPLFKSIEGNSVMCPTCLKQISQKIFPYTLCNLVWNVKTKVDNIPTLVSPQIFKMFEMIGIITK